VKCVPFSFRSTGLSFCENSKFFFLHLVVIDCFENYSVVICGRDCYLNSEIIDADGMGQKEQQQQLSLLSQISWDRLEMKSHKTKKQE
jgi:hypothetical protein